MVIEVWSSAYKSLPDYIKWVDEIGEKLANRSIKVKTNTNYDYIPMPERLENYPNKIFFGDFSDKTYSSPPVVKSYIDIDFSKRLTDFSIHIRTKDGVYCVRQ